MSIWSEFSRFYSSIVVDGLSSVLESIRTVFTGDAETRRRVAFSVAIIALSAKMAKADGVVTRAEIDAFQRIFLVPRKEFKHVSRLFNLAKQDVAGFDSYARQIRALFPGDNPHDQAILGDVVDALFYISMADGLVHENELIFLEEIAAQFGFDAAEFESIKHRHLTDSRDNPYAILGADPTWDFKRLKSHYRKRVAESHPDRLIARGVPLEFITVANNRLAALNVAWDAIEASHSKPALV